MIGQDDVIRNGYLPGVSCDVRTCSYHGQNNSCHAPRIMVNNPAAQNKAETLCGTYDHKPGL